MAWLDNYRQARFRNVDFFVPSAENSGGRRGAVHEFPKKDVPYIEDMGRQARRFNLEAYYIGEEYMSARDALAAALDQEGVGVLVHPYLGSLEVFCLGYSFRETDRETRMVRFSIQFIEAGSLSFPTYTVDSVSNVTVKKQTALEKIKDAFVKIYNIANVPYTVSQNVIDTIQDGLSIIEDAKKSVSAVSAFKRDIENLQGLVIQLAYDAEDLAQEVGDLITFGTNITDSFEATANNARNQIREMEVMWDTEPDQVIIEDDPAEMFTNMLQQNAVVNALGLMSILEYESLDEAQEIRNIVFTKLEEILLSLDLDDELYISLYDLQTAVTIDLESRTGGLARLIDYFPNNSLPALVVSYDLYGTIDQEQDIINRNKIKHPSFIPGGVSIKVLSNVE